MSETEAASDKIENVIICGSGPAGLTAALYAARANLDPLVLEGMQPGGQLTITTEVENYPGFEHGIQGPELMDVMKRQVARFGTRLVFDEVVKAELDQWPFVLHTAAGATLRTKVVIIATGASAKYLGLPNETRLQGYGVSACATCDGFFYRNQEVVVVGGGDTAAEEANYLSRLCSRVHLVVRKSSLRASKIMQQRVVENPKITVHWQHEVTDVLGDKVLTGVRVRDNRSGQESDWTHVTGLFLAIGHKPNADAFTPWLDHDETGYLITKPGTPETRIPGVFAAGDVQDKLWRQAVTAAGSGCMAAIAAERWLEEQSHSGR